MRRRVQLRGVDDVSSFNMVNGTCDVCGKRDIVVLYYDRNKSAQYKMLTWDDIVKRTIFGNAVRRMPYRRRLAGPRIGIQCGCYGRFMRQLAHIAHGVQRKIDLKKQDERRGAAIMAGTSEGDRLATLAEADA